MVENLEEEVKMDNDFDIRKYVLKVFLFVVDLS